MALSVFVGTFRSLTTDTAGVTTYTLVPGFTTKAGIVFHTGRGDAADASGGATQRTSIGMFTSTTNRFCCGHMSVDAAAAGSGNEFARADAVVASYTADTTTLDGRIDINSITSTNCVFRVEDVMPVDTTCGVMLFGGTDITNAIVVQFNTGTGTGTIDITTVGFQGTVAFFMGVGEIVDAPTADAAAATLMFGACTGAADEHLWWGGQDQASASADTGAYCLAGELLAEENGTINSPGTLVNRAAFSAWLSNGFQINRIETGRNGTRYYALVIQGGGWTVGDFVTLTSTGSITSETSGFGYTPKGVLCWSALRAASTADATTVHEQLSIGAADGSTQHAQAFVDEDGPANMEVGTAVDFDKVYVNIDTADAVVGLVSKTSFDADGITFNQDDADPAANFVCYVACGDTPVVTDAPAPPHTIHHLGALELYPGRAVRY